MRHDDDCKIIFTAINIMKIIPNNMDFINFGFLLREDFNQLPCNVRVLVEFSQAAARWGRPSSVSSKQITNRRKCTCTSGSDLTAN